MMELATCSEANAAVSPSSTRVRSCLLSFTTSMDTDIKRAELHFRRLDQGIIGIGDPALLYLH